MMDQKLNILHISDVHFTANPELMSHDMITTELIDAVKGYNGKLDYCVFTGDLADRALPEEYHRAGEWLEKVYDAMSNPEAKMLICPGNHDVDRKEVSLPSFRGASINSEIFQSFVRERETKTRNIHYFIEWHDTFAAKNKWVISSWEYDVNLVSTKWKDLNLNFIAVNSAILSCDNTDYGNLCININQLKRCIADAKENNGLNICLVHHPIEGGWYKDWNLEEFRTLTYQKRSCHLMLSGHTHDAEGSSSSNNIGQKITSLKCGAAYTDSKWKQEFLIIEIDIPKSELTPNVYEYKSSAGEWIKDNAKSQPIQANFSSVKSDATEDKKKQIIS
jgi:predicted MPP superfamily phosphohydrolase